jgi:O-antigen ligase
MREESMQPDASIRDFALRLGTWGAALELTLAAAAGAMWYALGGWVAYRGQGPGPLPLVLLGVMWSLRLVRSLPTSIGRLHLLPSIFAVSLILFVLSAGTSLLVAYDLGPAVAKAWLIVGALGFYWASAGQADELRITGALGFWVCLGTGVATFFLLTRDWSQFPAALGWLGGLLTFAGSQLPPGLSRETINSNVAAGVLTLVLPFFVPLLGQLGMRWRDSVTKPNAGGGRPKALVLVAFLVLVAALAISLLALVLTVSRGAWLALGITLVLWLTWRLTSRLAWPARTVVVLGVALVAALALGYLGHVIRMGWGSGMLVEGLREAIDNRVFLAQLGALLARDTLITGVGLGMFEMHFSIYTLLIHVGFVQHSHNMLIDLVIEQGILGAIAYGTMVILAVVAALRCLRFAGRRAVPAVEARELASIRVSLDPETLIESTLASVLAAFLHGVFDDPLYGSRAVLFAFVPFGMLVAAVRVVTRSSVPQRDALPIPRSCAGSDPHLLSLAIVGVLSALFVLSAAKPCEGTHKTLGRLNSLWYANLGAVEQARVELSVYDQRRFSDPTIDQVRRQADLGRADELLGRALEEDPDNTTANQRVIALALSRGHYDGAVVMAQRMWVAGARDRVTRLLYGDALVADGRPDEAVDAIQGLVFAKARLLGQHWSRYHLGGDVERAAWASYAAALLDD